MAAIDGGAFHNDVVCVGTRECLLFHERAFEDRAAMEAEVRAPPRVCSSRPSSRSAKPTCRWTTWWSYLFNSQLLVLPARTAWCCWPRARRATTPRPCGRQALASSNGPIGRVEYVDVRQSMRNGGGPACLRLRVVLTDDRVGGDQSRPAVRRWSAQQRLNAWAEHRYRDRLAPQIWPIHSADRREPRGAGRTDGDPRPWRRLLSVPEAALSDFTIRPATLADATASWPPARPPPASCLAVLARQPDEVTPAMSPTRWARLTAGSGGGRVDGRLCGEIHAERDAIALFAHVLTDLTVAVIRTGRAGASARPCSGPDRRPGSMTPPILRIELWTGAANLGAVRLYERLGFKIEGG
jgi:hypothetical protein